MVKADAAPTWGKGARPGSLPNWYWGTIMAKLASRLLSDNQADIGRIGSFGADLAPFRLEDFAGVATWAGPGLGLLSGQRLQISERRLDRRSHRQLDQRLAELWRLRPHDADPRDRPYARPQPSGRL